jgi:hypothetical protein
MKKLGKEEYLKLQARLSKIMDDILKEMKAEGTW